MRQRRWMEYLEDYDFAWYYHLGKAYVVVDALSRKLRGVLVSIASREWQMIETVGHFTHNSFTWSLQSKARSSNKSPYNGGIYVTNHN